jgi:hypothetical protein
LIKVGEESRARFAYRHNTKENIATPEEGVKNAGHLNIGGLVFDDEYTV